MSARALEKLRAYNAATEAGRGERLLVAHCNGLLCDDHEDIEITADDLRRVEAELRAETLAKATEALRGYLQKLEGKVGELFVDGLNDAIDIVDGLADDARIEAAS